MASVLQMNNGFAVQSCVPEKRAGWGGQRQKAIYVVCDKNQRFEQHIHRTAQVANCNTAAFSD